MTKARSFEFRHILVVLLIASTWFDSGSKRSLGCTVDAQAFQDEKRTKSQGFNSNSDFEDSKSKKSTLLTPILFRTDRPAHVIEGTSNAIENALKGVVGGAASFLGFPVVGAKHGGVSGFVIGVVLGSVAGISLPTFGIVLGVSQLVRGIKCTPSAIKDSLSSKTCKPQYLLDSEARDLSDKVKNQDSVRRSRKGATTVKNTLFYDILNVSPDATRSEIKRGYYKTAKECHPDKSTDADAEQKFLKIHTAYQTLSDAEKREKYDRNGPSIGKDGEFQVQDQDSLSAAIDPLVFFAVMFGSELVEPYIGELRIASEVDVLALHFNIQRDGQAFFDANGYYSASSESTLFQQQKRQVDIAIRLRERTAAYVTGAATETEFIQSCREEAEEIAKSAFGGIFLKAIGSSMLLESQQFLGFHTAIVGWARGSLSWLKKTTYEKRTDMRVYMAFLKSLKSLFDAASWSMRYTAEHMEETNNNPTRQDSESENKREPYSFHGPEMNREKLEEKLLDSLSTFLEMAWAFNVKDVADTVKDSCHKILFDEGVPMDVRLKRAKALRVLGREFYRVGKNTVGDEVVPRSVMNDVQERAEVALTSATLKAQGHDVTSEAIREEITRRQEERIAARGRAHRKAKATKTEPIKQRTRVAA